jgi:hypothetical protein
MQCFKFGRAIEISWFFRPVYRQKATTMPTNQQADRRKKKKPGSGLSRGVIPAHAVGNEVQRVNRKIKTLIILGVIVVIGFAWVFWMEEEPSALSIAYARISLDDPGQVLFSVTNTHTNTFYFIILEEQQTNGVWWVTAAGRTTPSKLIGQRGERHAHAVPQTTNFWRLAVYCYFPVPPADTFGKRARYKLSLLADKHQWTLFQRWLSPIKMRTTYGPEMLWNKPVEKKAVK